MKSPQRLFGLIATLSCLPACSSNDESVEAGSGWAPGTVYTTARDPGSRGLLDRRGLVHAHSVYSHDACDGEPRNPDGSINLPCLDDFRQGLCASRHDFVMLSDHNDSFSQIEYPDALLYDASKGDQLVQRDGSPVASFLACPEGHAALVMAGTETKTMPVGLERHVPGTPQERSDAYSADTPEALEKFKAMGAVTLVAHTEDWSVEQLSNLPLDGFEMYNLHANTILGAGAALGLIADLKTPEDLPYPDLVMLPLFSEDQRYLSKWGSVLAGGAKRVTTLGTDCHRNTFPALLPDGERIDSYRRMMGWFSNHLLVAGQTDGSFDDRDLKDALRGGRAYGAFEVLGFPVGFDFAATAAGSTHEMGETVSLSSPVQLLATRPHVENLDPGAKPPELTLRILRAKDGGWDVVAESGDDLGYDVLEPGAYRAEVRMKPRHLAKHLSSYLPLADKDFVWIYSNPIYVE